MARSFQIPGVVGVGRLLEQVTTGDQLIVDAYRGEIIVGPDENLVAEYRRRISERNDWFRKVEAEARLPAETLDGFRVQLAANVELPKDVENLRTSQGVGIGLFRTEFLFLDREDVPTEEEQFQEYRQVTEAILPQSVIFRTLDIGGDKFLSNVHMSSDLNPYLGVRAIRFCLTRPDIFKDQLRAILRASAFGKVRLMLPMISTLEELRQALDYLEEAKAELSARGVQHNRRMDVGIMIEVPSAALIADRLAPLVDFFSIGTNDLTQYTLAVERGNADLSHLYQPCHPSMIMLLQSVLHAAWRHGKWVSICGEMAGEPTLVPLILGLGIHELSMSAVAIGPVRRLIRRTRLYEAEHLVHRALQCGTSMEVWSLCRQFVARVAPDLLPPEDDDTGDEHEHREEAVPSAGEDGDHA
jgi:phosphotransferase system enzyme I (PtsI)